MKFVNICTGIELVRETDMYLNREFSPRNRKRED